MYPYLEDDFMEMGNSGWVPVGEGCFLNKHTGHTIDDLGREFDENGKMIYDPDQDNKEIN